MMLVSIPKNEELYLFYKISEELYRGVELFQLIVIIRCKPDIMETLMCVLEVGNNDRDL